MDDVKKQLNGEFNARLEELGEKKLGTEDYKSAVDSMTKIADKIVEIEKLEMERDFRAQQAECERAHKEQQIKESKKDRWTKTAVDVGKFGLGLGVTFLAFVASINYEEKGILTTQGGKTALKELLKFKF
jgi:hypothetical protein